MIKKARFKVRYVNSNRNYLNLCFLKLSAKNFAAFSRKLLINSIIFYIAKKALLELLKETRFKVRFVNSKLNNLNLIYLMLFFKNFAAFS